MEGIGAKKIMLSLMVLMMVVLAQGRGELADSNPTAETGFCIKKCAFKCVFQMFPSRIALCFDLCLIRCKLHPSKVVYNCTSGCANSMVNTYNPTDAEKVENFVGYCYETCKQKNNK